MHRNAKTFVPNKKDVKLTWFVLDATGKTLGRLSCEIVKILCGKHKPTFTPYMDYGDGVIIVNADKIRVTGTKEAQKTYHYYTGSIGGLREVPYRTMKARRPTYIIEHAVNGMMPKSRLARQQRKRLRVFAGGEHHLSAQQPIYVNI